MVGAKLKWSQRQEEDTSLGRDISSWNFLLFLNIISKTIEPKRWLDNSYSLFLNKIKEKTPERDKKVPKMLVYAYIGFIKEYFIENLFLQLFMFDGPLVASTTPPCLSGRRCFFAISTKFSPLDPWICVPESPGRGPRLGQDCFS